MSRFVHIDYPVTHPGIARFERVLGSARAALHRFDGARGAATLMLAAFVSALLVVANEVVDTWTEGHLLAAWIALWLVAFASLALFAEPARAAGVQVREQWLAWRAARKQAAEDEKLWKIALTDARVMADLSRAMSAAAERDVRPYF
jgi:hypothetical protein